MAYVENSSFYSLWFTFPVPAFGIEETFRPHVPEHERTIIQKRISLTFEVNYTDINKATALSDKFDITWDNYTMIASKPWQAYFRVEKFRCKKGNAGTSDKSDKKMDTMY
ncbi:hypothetical protein GZ77_00145 [Endozoicomonas montiporae]|uniref:Uncharacterized protein n=2 Tax=Endozoicomonas montiporae TaxID=1027273 RepID=A0A081N9M7_9GAMM|nr:hypothetical protein [Endozoicomonas montiporae]AMO55003.1 hypothetical protein EZMO1_0778 [Endozoicomonas montiporae CL-33]KEQ15150.1 hypothetical protein GZ77_00145 [Endozoicomonas montiporae]